VGQAFQPDIRLPESSSTLTMHNEGRLESLPHMFRFKPLLPGLHYLQMSFGMRLRDFPNFGRHPYPCVQKGLTECRRAIRSDTEY